MNSKEQFLLIKEKRGIYLGWKFPGGLADPNEDIFQTAQREVLEETGVETDFETVVTMRYILEIKYYEYAHMYYLYMFLDTVLPFPRTKMLEICISCVR